MLRIIQCQGYYKRQVGDCSRVLQFSERMIIYDLCTFILERVNEYLGHMDC